MTQINDFNEKKSKVSDENSSFLKFICNGELLLFITSFIENYENFAYSCETFFLVYLIFLFGCGYKLL